MMTRAGTPGGVFKQLKEFIGRLWGFGEAGPAGAGYPLYRLAPSRDLGVRRVRLSFLIGMTRAEPGRSRGKKAGNTVLNFPKPGKPAALVLTWLGLEPGAAGEPPVRVARVKGDYIVEKGWERLILASVLGLDYICARVTEYDYEVFLKKMRVFRFPEGTMVGVLSGNGKRYVYHGVGDGDLSLLLGRYRVTIIDRTVAPSDTGSPVKAARAGGGAAPVKTKRQLRLVRDLDD